MPNKLESNIFYKTFDPIIKEYNDEKMTIEHFISSDRQDYIGDIMKADGMVIVGKPVVLLHHGKGFMGGEPIAKPLWIRKGILKKRKGSSEQGIEANTKFFDDEQGIGRRLYQKTKEKYMPNWSIGYKAIPGKIKSNPNGRYIFEKWILLEYSLVGIGENPDAITKELGDGIQDLSVFYIPENIDLDDPPKLETGHFTKEYIITDDKNKTVSEMGHIIKDFETKEKSKSYYLSTVIDESNEIESKEATQNEQEEDTEAETVQATIEDSENQNSNENEQQILQKSIDSLTEKLDQFINLTDDTFKIINQKIDNLGDKHKVLEKKAETILIKNVPIMKKESLEDKKKQIDMLVKEISSSVYNGMIKDFRKKILGKID